MPGDIVVYEFSHTGIVSGTGDRESSFYAIEGNTNPGGGRDGYEVAERGRNYSSVRKFIRLPVEAALTEASGLLLRDGARSFEKVVSETIPSDIKAWRRATRSLHFTEFNADFLMGAFFCVETPDRPNAIFCNADFVAAISFEIGPDQR